MKLWRFLLDFTRIKVVMLTMCNQAKLLEEARKAGLHGYLLKDSTTSELLMAIRLVLAGETIYDPNVLGMSIPLEGPFGDDFARRLNLTFRETEVIRLNVRFISLVVYSGAVQNNLVLKL